MREILSAEQPCVLCGQLLEIVTIHQDDDTDEQHIRRERVEHSHEDCLSFARLYREMWPCHPGTVSPSPQGRSEESKPLACAECSALWGGHYSLCTLNPKRAREAEGGALTPSGDTHLLW